MTAVATIESMGVILGGRSPIPPRFYHKCLFFPLQETLKKLKSMNCLEASGASMPLVI